MKIIYFDIGANMAFAHNGFGDFVVTGHRKFEGPRAHRAGATRLWLAGRLEEVQTVCGLDLVVYERPFARGRDATRCLWGIAGIIEAEATNAGLPVVDAENKAVKKFATGGGAANKAGLLEAAQRLGYVGEIEHEADAYCGLKYAEKFCARTL